MSALAGYGATWSYTCWPDKDQRRSLP